MRKGHIILICMLTMATTAVAQMNDVPINLPKYDKQRAHFGFTLGVNSSNFVIRRKGDFRLRDSIYTVESSPVAGLNLGIISNLRLGEHFDLRFIPTLSFAQRNLNYDFIYPNTSEARIVKAIESTYLEFPFDLKFKSRRINNYRVYVVAGWKFAIDMISQAKVTQEDKDIVKLKRNDQGYQIGVGFDFYMTYFKFSPEIKMYNGLRNLLVDESTAYASPLEALYAKTFLISFTFE